jgi:hypothetical protein
MNLLELIAAVKEMSPAEAKIFLTNCGVHKEVQKAILDSPLEMG